ncbi:hypothetical protein RYB01_25610, partial [Pseudomonas syringae]|nr:hypothetical protein [Pseudomonas syringae]
PNAERWNDDLRLKMTIVPMLRVGMQFVTLCVTNWCRTAYLRQDAERPERHSHAERWNDELRLKMTIVPMLRVGMQFVTLCVTNWCRAAYLGQDAELPERHPNAERWNDHLKTSSIVMLSLLRAYGSRAITHAIREIGANRDQTGHYHS